VTFLYYAGSSLLAVKLLMLIVVCFKFAFYVFMLKIFEVVLTSYELGATGESYSWALFWILFFI
jgi:hypothetical protein